MIKAGNGNNQRCLVTSQNLRGDWHPNSWAKADKEADTFFVYILKLDDQSFYVGQTRELRERLSEHRVGRVHSTAGHRFKLQYFEMLPSRKAAEMREAELMKLNNSNQRQIRRMIISFLDLIHEVEQE